MIWLLLPVLLALAFTLVCIASLFPVPVPVPVPVPDLPSPSPSRPVFILRPVEHPDAPWLTRIAEESRSLTHHHAATRTVTVIVCGPSVDQAVAPFEGLLAANSDVTDDATCNRKVRHLAAGARLAATLAARDPNRDHANDPLLVQVDADVHLQPTDLDALIATLEASAEDDVAFAFPAIAIGSGSSPASWLSAAILMSSPQSFAVVAGLARLTRSPPAIAGKCVALRRSTLERLGGYASIERAIGDDVVLMQRIRELGGHARAVPRAVLTMPGEASLGSLVARMTRWLRVIRAQRPHLLLAYPTLIAPLPLALALSLIAALASTSHSAWAWAPVAALLAARTLLAWVLARGAFRGHATRSALAAPFVAVFADAVLLLAFAAALAERRIVWAGRVYDVGSGGRISGVRSA